MRYSFDSRIRFSETCEDEKLSYTSIVNYLQDCSNFQSQELGLGADALAKKGRAWVLLGWQIEINRRPEVGEEIEVTTWPYGFKGFYGSRNYVMDTKEGERLAYANTVWAYLDVKSQMPTKVDDEEIAGYQIEDRLDMNYAPRKVKVPAESEELKTFVVKQTNLDLNHHVNNGQYVAMAEPYLPTDFEVGQMRVEYRKQAKLDDTILPLINITNEQVTIALCNEDKEPYAVVEFNVKKSE